MNYSPCCALWTSQYGCSSHNFPPATVKIRYVIQYRVRMHNHKTGESWWSVWTDGVGDSKYKYSFSNLAEAKKALANARRRQTSYEMKYQLVQQVSTWNVIG